VNVYIPDNSQRMSFYRRSWLKAAWRAFGFASTGFSMQSGRTRDWALTKDQRDRLTPDGMRTQMKFGNSGNPVVPLLLLRGFSAAPAGSTRVRLLFH
jgi:hypothetical protein